jgi:hypothetical protein
LAQIIIQGEKRGQVSGKQGRRRRYKRKGAKGGVERRKQ